MDPGLCSRATWMGGGIRGDTNLRSRGLWYGWNHSSLGNGLPPDAVSLVDRQQCFETGKTVRPQLVSAAQCWHY